MTPSRDDAAVFTRIFDQHRHAVNAYFLGRVADPELARDLLQETFLRAWRRLSEIGPLPGEQQRAWIFTVARNLAIDSYPRQRRPPGRRGSDAPPRRDPADHRRRATSPRGAPRAPGPARRRHPQFAGGPAGDAGDGHRRGADQPPDWRGAR